MYVSQHGHSPENFTADNQVFLITGDRVSLSSLLWTQVYSGMRTPLMFALCFLYRICSLSKESPLSLSIQIQNLSGKWNSPSPVWGGWETMASGKEISSNEINCTGKKQTSPLVYRFIWMRSDRNRTGQEEKIYLNTVYFPKCSWSCWKRLKSTPARSFPVEDRPQDRQLLGNNFP